MPILENFNQAKRIKMNQHLENLVQCLSIGPDLIEAERQPDFELRPARKKLKSQHKHDYPF